MHEETLGRPYLGEKRQSTHSQVSLVSVRLVRKADLVELREKPCLGLFPSVGFIISCTITEDREQSVKKLARDKKSSLGEMREKRFHPVHIELFDKFPECLGMVSR